MRTFNQITISIVIFAVLALSACFILPFPWPVDDPRYSNEQLSKIREGYSSQDEVISVLGSPDIQRLDRYWVYNWKVESGRLFGMFLGIPSEGPLFSKLFVLLLEFDKKGILISKQFVKESGNKYCTERGLCLDHNVYVGNNWGATNRASAITISGLSKDFVPWPALGGDRCVVVLWPDARDWKDLQGLRLSIGNPPQGPPSLVPVPYGSYALVSLPPPAGFFWLPVGSYLALSLPAGLQSVLATDPFADPLFNKGSGDIVANFQCKANQTIYMEVGKISKSSGGLDRDQFSIVLKTIDPETGRHMIAEMPRLLPP